MKKDDTLLMIDANTLEITRRMNKKEFIQDFNVKQREIINGMVKDYILNRKNTKYPKTYKGYFYCLKQDYDINRIKQFIFKNTYYNYFPNFKPNLILLYFNNILVNEFKSERKCAEYLGIKYQSLNYGLRSKGYFKINGFKAVRKEQK